MKFANIFLGANVEIDPTATFNNVVIGDNVKIAKQCTLFGSAEFPLEIQNDSYIGMNTTINGYHARVTIGDHVSIAQHVNIMADSGPNASAPMQRIFPIIKGEIFIGNHSWIGANVVIMPGVRLGKFCVVGANSFVNKSFSDYSVIGGSPAKIIRRLTDAEIEILTNHD
ncbi:MAG: acyltransferase [Bacteroidota bacterium]